ncbi:MAG: MBL fold metallo-hydrolase [Chlamydiales bacterium]|nr:MBL fold metallo-hydrolase [Chlamydiales bacterium]
MKKKSYNNPHTNNIKKRVVDIVKWQLGVFQDALPPPQSPKSFEYPNQKEEIDPSKPQVVWINHSTFLISVYGMNILTDPIWSNRCSPVPFIGPKRMHAPAIKIEDLPEIHMVLVSHDHYDHLDKKSVDKLHERFPSIRWIVPKGLKPWFLKRGISNVAEHAWWQESLFSFEVGNLELVITAVPCQHFSGRLFWHSNNTLWCSYVVKFKKDRKVKYLYFVGDTGYNDYDFKTIGEHFPQIDLSLIPIGTYVPHEFMAPVHIDPEKAVKIHQEVKSKLSVGMHWKTFKLSSEGMMQPPYDLYLSLKEENINPRCFRVIDPGQAINW